MDTPPSEGPTPPPVQSPRALAPPVAPGPLHTPSASPKFGPGHIILLALGALALPLTLAALVGRYGYLKDQDAFAQGLGAMVCTAFAMLLISAAVWLATRKRTHWAGVSTFAVSMLLIATIGGLAIVGVMHTHESAALVRELCDVNERLMADITRAADASDDAGVEKAITDHGAQLDAMARRTSGNEAIVLRVSGSYFHDMGKLIGQYRQAADPLTRGGGVKASALKSIDDVRAKRDVVKQAVEAHAPLLALVANAREELRRRALAQGASPADAEKVVTAMLKDMQAESLTRIYQMERELLDLIDGRLKDLEDKWGTWRWDEAENKVIFQEPPKGFLDTYRARALRLTELAKEQSDLQNQMQEEARQKIQRLRGQSGG